MTILTYEKYNKNRFAVRGDMDKHQSFVKSLNGRVNKRMKGGEGWLVDIKYENELKEFVNNQEDESDIEQTDDVEDELSPFQSEYVYEEKFYDELSSGISTITEESENIVDIFTDDTESSVFNESEERDNKEIEEDRNRERKDRERKERERKEIERNEREEYKNREREEREEYKNREREERERKERERKEREEYKNREREERERKEREEYKNREREEREREEREYEERERKEREYEERERKEREEDKNRERKEREREERKNRNREREDLEMDNIREESDKNISDNIKSTELQEILQYYRKFSKPKLTERKIDKNYLTVVKVISKLSNRVTNLERKYQKLKNKYSELKSNKR